MFNFVDELRLGRFKSACENHEHRWFTRDLRAYLRVSIRCQAGTVKRSMVRCLCPSEQGLGDQILFTSMLAECRRASPSLTSRSQPRLVPLLARSFPQIRMSSRARTAGFLPVPLPRRSAGQPRRLFPSRLEVLSSSRARLFSVRRGTVRSTARRLADGRTVIGVSWSSRRSRYGTPKSAQLMDFESILQLSELPLHRPSVWRHASGT